MAADAACTARCGSLPAGLGSPSVAHPERGSVPQPGTLFLVGSGLLGFAMTLRRRLRPR
jgi:PEP-CTERM motif